MDAKTVRELFDYDPETGILRRRTNRGGRRIGSIAGSPDKDGYIRVGIADKDYRAHRLIWLHFYGEWPKKLIDHKNRIVDDNRIENLRLADDGQNQVNSKIQSNNRSGIKGVCLNKETKKWCATIYVNRARIHLGYFITKDAAADAYRAASLKYHGEYSTFHSFP